MDTHIKVVGIIYTIFGALGVLGAAVVFMAMAGGGLMSGDAEAAALLGGIGLVVAGFIAVLSLPALAAGIGLLQRRSWARIVTLIVSFLNLLNIPFGTALGGYAIWVMLQDETVQILSQGARPQAALA